MADEDAVGYGKPPKHSRFRPGRSGNPRGRPRGSRNLKTDLAEELRARVTIREGGRETRVSKQRAMVKALIAKGAQGDTKAASKVLDLIERLLVAQEEQRPAPPVSAEEQVVLDTLAERFASSSRPGNAGDAATRSADDPGRGPVVSPREEPPPAAETDYDTTP